MTLYIGTKRVLATPMNRLAYNEYRGWDLPEAEDPTDEGYLVEYVDGGAPNDHRHAGYISWSPKAQFDAAYRQSDNLSFGLALEVLQKGGRVARAGWNGKGMWLLLVRGYDYNPDKGESTYSVLGCEKLPWIGMKTADNKFVPWLASQTDMLADDWQLL
jgi:hypothetical protein